MTLRLLFVLLAVLVSGIPSIQAEEPVKPAPVDAKKEEPASKKPEPKPVPASTAPTHTVKAEPFVQKVKVSGTVQSIRETPVEMNLKRWSDLTVIRAAAHGTPVKAGEVIIELETKDLVKKIDELKRALPSQELDLAAAELELDKAEKATPLSLEKAMRDKMEAEQDLVHFEDEDRPMQERGAREDVKEITESLAYAQEELNQLKKMYEKDNLTEETEEIILRRAENTVARYQWMLEQTEARTERTLNVMLPRTHESLKRSLEMRQIEWRAGEKAMRDGLEKARLSTAAKRREMEETRKALAEHEEDLAAMRVTAPHDGIVYYGMSQRAKWTTAAIVDRKLIPGGKLSMREIVMTIVDPSKVRVLLSLTEEQLADLAEGQKGVCQAKWKPDVKFGATLESILYVPYADKTFDAVLSLKTPKEAPALLPGMSADAELVVYEKADALTVPKAAVKKEGERELVTLSDGKTVTVKTGRAEGDRFEILEGLKAGAVVRLPEVKKDDAGKEAKPEAPSAPAKKE
jgi:multidrug efflux pump subunit AcrA (membrane-fusion protein)